MSLKWCFPFILWWIPKKKRHQRHIILTRACVQCVFFFLISCIVLFPAKFKINCFMLRSIGFLPSAPKKFENLCQLFIWQMSSYHSVTRHDLPPPSRSVFSDGFWSLVGSALVAINQLHKLDDNIWLLPSSLIPATKHWRTFWTWKITNESNSAKFSWNLRRISVFFFALISTRNKYLSLFILFQAS